MSSHLKLNLQSIYISIKNWNLTILFEQLWVFKLFSCQHGRRDRHSQTFCDADGSIFYCGVKRAHERQSHVDV